MIRSHEVKKGSMTVFCSLLFMLLVSFFMSLFQVGLCQVAKSRHRIELDCAMESFFAGYNRTLLERYSIFGKDVPYKTVAQKLNQKVQEELSYYGAPEGKLKVNQYMLLTDDGGECFHRQAYAYGKEKGIPTYVKETLFLVQIAKMNQIFDRAREQVFHFLELLSFVLEEELEKEDFKESNKETLDLSKFPSKRPLEKGRGTLPRKKEYTILQDLMANQYFLDHFSTFLHPESSSPIQGELEYIISGGENDDKNKKTVREKIQGMRMAINYSTILQHQVYRQEAKEIAFLISSLILLPEIEPAIAHGMLLWTAWEESKLDQEKLCQGGRVPLFKQEHQWSVSPMHVWKKTPLQETTTEEGLSYATYLLGILGAMSQEEKTMRALDIVEMSVQQEKGRSGFQVDHCICEMDVSLTTTITRRAKWQFGSQFCYR